MEPIVFSWSSRCQLDHYEYDDYLIDYFKFNVILTTETDYVNNSTNIYASITLYKPSFLKRAISFYCFTNDTGLYMTFKADGQEKNLFYSLNSWNDDAGETKTLVEKTLIFTIPHNADGTKNITISVGEKEKSSGKYLRVLQECRFTSTDVKDKTYDYFFYPQTQSKTLDLDPAYKPSTITATNATIGSASTITINRLTTSYTHTLTYEFAGTTGTIATKTTAGSYKWTIPETFYSLMPNDKSKTCKILCYTYVGSTLVGSATSATIIVSADPNRAYPTLIPEVKDTNSATVALTGNEKALVRYKSNAYYNMNAAASPGATLITRQAKNGSQIIRGATTGTFTGVESKDFTFTIIDSRDYAAVSNYTAPTFVEYVKLTCNQRINMDLVGETGATAKVEIEGYYFKGSFGKVSNTLTLQYRYTDNNGAWTNWINASNISYGTNTYSFYTEITGFSYSRNYTFQCRAIDKLETITTPEYVIKVKPVFDWSEGDFRFNVPVNVDGNIYITKNKTIEMGGNASISEVDGVLTLDVSGINFNTNGFTINGANLAAFESGTWKPTLNSSAVSSYTNQYGWYQRMDKVATIGFNITAVCNSGYQTTNISIGGMPFTPDTAAWGGGVCYNAYIGANLVFEGWNLGTDGSITARLQPTNRTSAGNLNVASSCCYPTGGGTLTIGGTICFLLD